MLLSLEEGKLAHARRAGAEPPSSWAPSGKATAWRSRLILDTGAGGVSVCAKRVCAHQPSVGRGRRRTGRRMVSVVQVCACAVLTLSVLC